MAVCCKKIMILIFTGLFFALTYNFLSIKSISPIFNRQTSTGLRKL